MEINPLSSRVIGAAIEVHKNLGPGLLESAYEESLCWELAHQQVPFERQRMLPLNYKGHALDCGYRLDILVDNQIVLELKSVERIEPIHKAQLLTYLKLSGYPMGLLLNFNVPLMRTGIVRLVNRLKE
jgi:GxxExxY protein